MCGIAGFFSPNDIGGVELKTDILKEMASVLKHRGPDDFGAIFDEGCQVGLVHTRLSILDLSKAGHQPMVSLSGRYVISFNGEIYNHNELRKMLPMVNWRGSSDTETICASFEEWGVSTAIKKMTGMFAIAILDKKNKELSIVRDRCGEKPLYYFVGENHFIFSSELKALKKYPKFNGAINKKSLTEFIDYGYISSDKSIYHNTFKCLPGEIVKYNLVDNSIIKEKYWALENIKNNEIKIPDTKIVSGMNKLLLESVKEQMISDVPIGAFLSGGIDSSLVVALMKKVSPSKITTFSIGFNEDSYNEAHHAKMVAEYLGTNHHELYVSDDQIMGLIPELSHTYDEPFGDVSKLPTMLVSELASKYVKVALTGDGADELFCGYPRYFNINKTFIEYQNSLSFKKMKLKLLSTISSEKLNSFYERLSFKKRSSKKGYKIHRKANIALSKSLADMYLQETSFSPYHGDIVLGKDFDPSFGIQRNLPNSYLEEMMYYDFHTYLPDNILVKVDRAAMHYSLETRAPFLNHRVVEEAWNLPLHCKVREDQSKWILREVLYDLVPKNILDRPKMGFGVPISSWLRTSLRTWAEKQISVERLTSEGFFDVDFVRSLWEEHVNGLHDWGQVLWNILMFQSWYENECF
jgi:asparagine synthase (glutamine-hydrolysing)